MTFVNVPFFTAPVINLFGFMQVNVCVVHNFLCAFLPTCLYVSSVCCHVFMNLYTESLPSSAEGLIKAQESK